MSEGISFLEWRKPWGYIASVLSRRSLTIFVLLCWYAAPSSAQLPKRLERCLPIPTLAQEIRDMQQEVRDKQFPEPVVHVRVIQVKFDPDGRIPPDIQNEISKKEAGRTHGEEADSDYLKDAASEVAEVAVRGALQRLGYFRPIVDAKLTVLKTRGSDIDVAVSVSADPGDQYFLGEILFEPANADFSLVYSSQALRVLVPLKRGDLLNVDAIREGLGNVTRLYGRQGYIDMTAEPEFDGEDSTHRHVMNVVFRIDQQKQYRVGEVEFWGVPPRLEQRLRESYQKSGEVFDKSRLEKFFKDNRALLPADVDPSWDVSIRRDTLAGTIDLVFDFRSCPGQTN